MKEPKHQGNIDAKVKKEIGMLALKLNRLETAINEFVRTVNAALYQKEKRLNDYEDDIRVIREEIKKIKTSDPIKVKSE